MSTEHNTNSADNQSEVEQPTRTGFPGAARHFPINRLAWLWLLVGFALLPFTAWQNVIPLAAWLLR
jgi:hypothetical protein